MDGVVRVYEGEVRTCKWCGTIHEGTVCPCCKHEEDE